MRLLDIIAGALGLPLLGLPLAVLFALGLRFDFQQTLTVARGARLFWRRRLVFRDGPLASIASWLGLAHIFDCVALLRGRLALVGPRPLAPLAPHAVASYRIAVRPGVLSPFAVRQWAGIAADTEDAVDFAYASRRSWTVDLGLLLHAVFARTHGAKVSVLSAIQR